MRVIAGTARSLPLKAPKGLDTRPTTDRIKETLFNVIQSRVPDGIFVDLFAGSGAIGIEALSRGARHAYFIENEKEAVSCIRDNLSFTKFTDKATLLKMDASSALSAIPEREVDILFMDPPYGLECEESLFCALSRQDYVTEDTLIIVEARLSRTFDFLGDLGFVVEKEKRYKTNKHVFCRKEAYESSNLPGEL